MENSKIAVIGLGYVGLPLAHLFAKKYPVIGFDLNESRVKELRNGEDKTLNISSESLRDVLASHKDMEKGLYCTHREEDITKCNYYIITVPTPVDSSNKPDLDALHLASNMVGKVLERENIVIYESTVYPGATEDECVPILENVSGLKFNLEFFVGYSPERINPGDTKHTIDRVIKVTSGSTPSSAMKIDALYASVIQAGTYKASSIKVAEAAKIIENCQRDINIAFVNELAKIFNLMNIDTQDVLKVASTKWNFLHFKPGLVGGHCIGVDPYYLAHKAQEFGYHPEIILSGRRMNDGMSLYVASEVVKLMVQKDIRIRGSRVLVMGITFKENCPDVRNTKVIDLIKDLMNYGTQVTVYDPVASKSEVLEQYGLVIENRMPENTFDAIILAVAHQDFLKTSLRSKLSDKGILYDVKGVLNEKVDARL